jgi:hypothetical protein
MTSEMELVVGAGGYVRCVYGEELDLREIGKLQINWASHVEPDRDGFWWADMGPVGGPGLGPFKNRTEALEAERVFITLSFLWARHTNPIASQSRQSCG